MSPDPIAVTVHPSQFPEAIAAQVTTALRQGEVPGKLHYLSWRQARAWLTLHQRHAPYCTAADGVLIYDRAAAEAVKRLPAQPVTVISLGCGAGQKDLLLLRRLAPRSVRYVPVDAGLDLLLGASQIARATLGPGTVSPQLMDLTAEADWVGALEPALDSQRSRVILFYGLLPGMDPAVAGARLRRLLRKTDLLLLSANLAPGSNLADGAEAVLPLYDNAETRAWLALALEDLGIDPGAGSWRCAVVEDASLPGLQRIEVRFEPEHDAVVSLGAETALLRAGRSVRLLRSNRFSVPLLETWARAHGLVLLDRQVSHAGDEGVFLAALAPA